MQVEIKIDESRIEPKVTVETREITDEINSLVKKIKTSTPFKLVGYKDGCAEILETNDVIRIYSSEKKTVCETEKEKYTLKFRLYELEEKLDPSKFVRISNSEIINLSKVKNFDLSFAGTVCVRLKNGEVTYVSRRYVKAIKTVLGL